MYGRVHGVDISPTMVEIAKQRLKEQSNVEFQTTDGSTLLYPDETFDLVFSYLVFPHIDSVSSIEQYMREIHRTLKKGAVAKIQLRTGQGVRRWIWSYGVSFTNEEAIALAENQGFAVIDHQVEDIKYLWLTLKK